MRLVVAGRPEEVIGFRLAGVETVVCPESNAAEGLVASLCAEAAGVGLLMLTPWMAHYAPRAIAAARGRRGPPVVTTIPNSETTGG